MKRIVILALLVVVAFVAFSVLHNRAISNPANLENKVASASSAKNSPTTQQRKKAVEPESPYLNGKAKFIEEAFDFGLTPTNSTVYHPFYVTNVGTDTLDIIKVKPG